MHVVINIPKDIYNEIKREKFDAVRYLSTCLKVIKDGTPLPKGHGRLIDENDLWPHCIDFCVAYDDIKSAPTIVEAD